MSFVKINLLYIVYNMYKKLTIYKILVKKLNLKYIM